ncbi:MAG: hypothetical protein CBC35_11295 [Planctomycetes bacterium TMED75]|nr:hypothetical protein [Planctomycetaceae bacterium]OUU90679.1 MAG: hypothetical protein CBC35_11295 [Planctomycetes bacterium TMED75]
MSKTHFLHWTSSLLLLVTIASCPCGALAQGNYIETDPYDSSVAAITRGLQVRRDGSNHNILLALRQMKDQRMRPLFQSMFASDEPSLQIDALLALAEIDEGPIDPFLLQQLSPRDRQLAIMAAVSLDLMDEGVIRGIKNYPDLNEAEKTMAVIVGVRLGMEFDRTLIDELLKSKDATTRLIASVLLSDATEETAQLEEEIAHYNELPLSERIFVVSALIDIASWHPMPSSLALLRQAANDQELSRSLRLAAVDSALGCECENGIVLWQEATRLAQTSGDRSRLGVAAIERGLRTEKWDGISDERQLNQKIARAGASLHDGSDSFEAVQQLLQIRHPLSLQAGLALAEHTDDPRVAEAIRMLVMEEGIKDVRIQPVIGRVMREFGQTAPEGLERLVWKISKLENRTLLGEILLTAVLEENPDLAQTYAKAFEEHPDRTIRSLVILIKARGPEPLDQETKEELAVIATGGGRVSRQVRAIAAWLWLSHHDKTDQAMREIIGKS